ncbi:MAG: hypothetical protein QOF49_36, partial [Chloroflexota bacterium]|nr:hypothetical protein [Chloroflexota bacterium]
MSGPNDPASGPHRRRVLLDISPLRQDRDFRRLWSGQVVNQVGNQITRLALPYQIYAQTGSTLAIAALALFQLVPLVAFSLGAGSIVDVVDRRKLLIRTQIGLMACSGLLFVLSLQGSVPLVILFAIAFLSAAIGSLDQPARWSSTARLVPASRLPAAIALNQLNITTAAVVGPTVAGLIIASAGLPIAYLADFLTFVAALVALVGMAPLPPVASATRPGLAAIREGLRFAFGRRVILSTYVIDLNAMIFGLPVSLFPALALDVFHAGPEGLGLLAAAPAVGAMLGALFSGWVARVRRVGRAVIVSVAVWGIAITLFGLAQFSFPLALLCLAVAGAADITSA